MKIKTLYFASLIGLMSLLVGCERFPMDSVQHGYRGTGMVQVYNLSFQPLRPMVLNPRLCIKMYKC